MKLQFALMLFCTLVFSCRCDGPISSLQGKFKVDPAFLEVDFGRVLEKTAAQKTVRLVADTRLPINVKATVAAPFGTPSAQFVVPGGADIEIEVNFLAGNGPSMGTLFLVNADDETNVAEIRLKGLGVRPLECLPTKPCRDSKYDFATHACIESVSADETACDTQSLCLDKGRCFSGMCLGQARKCDDANPCTDDGCSMESGCVYVPHQCPIPANPCRAAVCNPTSGCADTTQPEGTPCGSLDCVTAHICALGVCQAIATPDGVPCSPELACLPAGTCKSQKCERPDAGTWIPDWTVSLKSPSNKDLVFGAGNLFLSTCSAAPDAGTDAGIDAGLDAGIDGGFDAGEVLDGGEQDASIDAGGDAGPLDAGALDASVLDASLDSGVDGGLCHLLSYTSTGFERFDYRLENNGPYEVSAVGSKFVVLNSNSGQFSLRSLSTGTQISSFSYGENVIRNDTVYQLDPSGTLSSVKTDAGMIPLVSLGQFGKTALNLKDELYTFDADAGRLLRFSLRDGGVTSIQVVAPFFNALSVSGTHVLLGHQVVVTDRDGGLVFKRLDAGVPFRSLQAQNIAAVFMQRCRPLTSCVQYDNWLEMYDLNTASSIAGSFISEFESAVLDATFINSPIGFPPVAVVLEEQTDAGMKTVLTVLADGKRSVKCELPNGIKSVEWSDSRLFVVSASPDGGETLGAYPLKALQPLNSGWARPNSRSGTRAEQ
jgi:hypothetical protein